MSTFFSGSLLINEGGSVQMSGKAVVAILSPPFWSALRRSDSFTLLLSIGNAGAYEKGIDVVCRGASASSTFT